MINKRIALITNFEKLSLPQRREITRDLKAGTLTHLPIDLILCFLPYLRPEVVASLPVVASPLSLDARRE